jgi:hypothetical protein
MLFDDELVKGGKREEGSENLKLETRNPKSKFQIPKP